MLQESSSSLEGQNKRCERTGINLRLRVRWSRDMERSQCVICASLLQCTSPHLTIQQPTSRVYVLTYCLFWVIGYWAQFKRVHFFICSPPWVNLDFRIYSRDQTDNQIFCQLEDIINSNKVWCCLHLMHFAPHEPRKLDKMKKYYKVNEFFPPLI